MPMRLYPFFSFFLLAEAKQIVDQLNRVLSILSVSAFTHTHSRLEYNGENLSMQNADAFRVSVCVCVVEFGIALQNSGTIKHDQITEKGHIYAPVRFTSPPACNAIVTEYVHRTLAFNAFPSSDHEIGRENLSFALSLSLISFRKLYRFAQITTLSKYM